ncbi:MAG TPA: DUF4276 family protein [Pirellulales bacterium]|nr:DUF4276 family protein [Pirellulales bacterium]
MFGILGEDDSDIATLRTLVRRITSPSVRVKGKGYDGCAKLLAKGAGDILIFRDLGVRRFIVSYDADKSDPAKVRSKVWESVVSPTGLAEDCCIVVPVQEIEAWILADMDAIRQVVSSFRPPKPIPSPEHIQDPKEYLERLSKDERGIKLYRHASHNEKVAVHLNLPTVRAKCPSYRPFEDFVLAPS